MASTIVTATPAQLRRAWDEGWGGVIVSLHREYAPEDVEGLVVLTADGDRGALAAWHREGETAELVLLEAYVEGHGYASRALAAAEDLLRADGVRRLWLMTTNDNVRAIPLYLRKGYRLVAVHLDHMDAVRERKPRTPLVGDSGIPLRDAWEFEKSLG